MRKFFVFFIFVLIISACNKDKDSSSDTSFRIKSGSLTKFNSPVPGTATSYNINSSAHTGSYAIIFNSNINSTNYVGIACSNDPNAETYNLKIYYSSPSIASGTYSANIVENGTPYSESLTLTIALNTTYTTSTYNVYDINGTSTNVGVIAITAIQGK